MYDEVCSPVISIPVTLLNDATFHKSLSRFRGAFTTRLFTGEGEELSSGVLRSTRREKEFSLFTFYLSPSRRLFSNRNV